jgi:hypothetical protein
MPADSRAAPELEPAPGFRDDSLQSLVDAAARERPPGPTQRPVIGMTSYERVATFFIALLVFLVLTVTTLTVNYIATRPKAPAAMAELELFEELPGGSPDGSPDETLRVDSPYEERADASLVDNPSDEPSQVEAVFDSIMEASDEAAEGGAEEASNLAVTDQAPQQFLLDVRTSGRRGSATGTGRRGLGFGPGKRGFPRDQRWFISFSDRVPVSEYARQLDYFGIELGAVGTDKISYVSAMSTAPKVRTANTGKGENRLYMNWQGGTRRLADVELLKNSGVDAEGALVLHFYPANTEATLAKLERAAAKLPVDQIRRTYFAVKNVDKGYEFEVTKIAYSK